MQAAWRVRPADHGHRSERRADGAAGRRVRVPRQDVPDRGGRHGSHRGRAGHDADRARRGKGRYLACLSGEGRADPRLGEARRHPGEDHRHAGGVLARQEPGARRAAHREGHPVPARARHQRTRHPHHVRRRGRALLARADAGGQGHDLGDRQRPARLQHRPVSDPRARHQREDALDRAAHGRRGPLRDRRRRLGAQACRAVPGRGTSPVGFPRRVPRAGGVASITWAARPATLRAKVFAEALHKANTKFLDSDKSPSRKVGELDTRGSHFYLALYWAEALAAQTEDKELQARFAKVARELAANEAKILAELKAAQGRPVEIGGYFRPESRADVEGDAPQPDVQRHRGRRLLTMSVTTAADGLKDVTTPLSDADVESLRTGDRVRITGVVYTRARRRARTTVAADPGRQAAARSTCAARSSTTPARRQRSPATSSAPIGPTTGSRMDKFTPGADQAGAQGHHGQGRPLAAGQGCVQAVQGRLLRRASGAPAPCSRGS